MNLSDVSDADLLSNLGVFLGSARELTARVVAHLGEVEERRLHLEAGYSSMFDFCLRRLHLSEGEAYLRIVAARLARRYPIIYPRLTSGAVHLSVLALLRDRLTEENHVELLDVVSGKTKREVEAILAARYPSADVPSKIRKLPQRVQAVEAMPPRTTTTPTIELAPHPTAPAPTAPPPARIQPLSESRHKVQFTVSTELRGKLERARDLLSHANPSRDLADVVERALDVLLADLEKKKLGKRANPRHVRTERAAKPGHVTTADRRTVFARDGARCTFVGHDGHRCDARAFLELDHVYPKGLGGDDDAANLRILCRSHNQLLAERVYGRDAVERLRLRWRNRVKRPAPAP